MKDAMLTFANRVDVSGFTQTANQLGDILEMAWILDSDGSTKLPSTFPEYSVGKPLELVIEVNEDCGGTGAVTNITLQTDTVETFASPTTIGTGRADVAIGTLVAGYREIIHWLPAGNEGYLRVVVTVGTADYDAGVMSAYFATGAKQENPNT